MCRRSIRNLKNLQEPTPTLGSCFYIQMASQKDLSEWFDITKVGLDKQIVNSVNKPYTIEYH